MPFTLVDEIMNLVGSHTGADESDLSDLRDVVAEAISEQASSDATDAADFNESGLTAYQRSIDLLDAQIKVMREALREALDMRQRVGREAASGGLPVYALETSPLPAGESGYIASLTAAIRDGSMDWVQPTTGEEFQFKTALKKYGAWLSQQEAVRDAGANLPEWGPEGLLGDVDLQEQVFRTMAALFTVEGSTMRNHPTPRGWLFAHLLDSLGEVLTDWVQSDFDSSKLDPERHADAFATLVFLAVELGLHEVGEARLGAAHARVSERWLKLDVPRVHAGIYRLQVWDGHDQDSLVKLRKAGLLDD